MKLKFIFILLLSAVSSWAFALGLGSIELNSGLNQPFDAKIELLSPTVDDLNTINIGLASIEDFQRVGIDRPFILSQLRFTVEEGESGPDYIRITSKDAIREPFLNFLLEANWSNGRLFRKYTVLLDPPLYDPNVRRSLSPEVPSGPTSMPVAPTVSSTEQPSVDEQDTGTSFPSSVFSGDSYGPISSSETLWSVASRVRPDNSITIQQMMLALLRANPDAFIDNNINGLKRGQILRIPDRDEITSQSSEEALAAARSQNALWEEFSGIISSDPDVHPVSSTDTMSVETEVIASESEPELRLVSPTELGEGGGLTNGTDTDISGNSEDLDLANEQLETLSSENVKLRERSNESEAIIQDLRRLIELKDDELATLQQQLAGGGIATEDINDLDIEEDVEELESEDFGSEEFDVEEADVVENFEEQTSDEDMGEFDDLVSEVTEQIEEEVEEIAAPASVVTTVQSPSKPGLVEQIMDWVKGNLMIVGGAILTIVLAGVAVVFIRKKKAASGDEQESAALPTEFPDFSSTAEEAPAPESEIEEEEPDFDLSAEPEDGDDILNISSAGGEDLLDVTAHTDLEINEDEDLLDVTAATSLEPSTEDVPPEPEQDDSDDNALDFDIGGIETTGTDNTADDVASSSDNVVDFDSSAASTESDDGLDLDMGIDIEAPAESLEVDMDSGEEDGGIELDLGSDEIDSGDSLELDSGVDTDDDGGIELDLGTDEDTGGEGLELSLDSDVVDEGIELDLSMEDESEGGDLEIDMDSTMEMPKESKLSLDQDDDDDDDDDDEDHTVFVPRTSDATEQTQEDEIATKLDLAKAYVELGDKDSAKPILDEVVNDGNDKQRKQAEELLSQIS